MAIEKKKAVYACERCDRDYPTEKEANACYEAHPETEEFKKLLKEFEKMKQRVQDLCPHHHTRYSDAYETMDFTDSRFTARLFVCTDCGSVWEKRV